MFSEEPAPRIPASDALSHSLRIALASHPRFPAEIHQRLTLDCLYEVPTQRLSMTEVVEQVARKFGGLHLTTEQARAALDGLVRAGALVVEPEARSGMKRYGLSTTGVQDWEQARSAGIALELRVKNAFLNELEFEDNAEHRSTAWNDVISRLEALFRREAYETARVLVAEGDLESLAASLGEESANDDEGARRLSLFIRTATGDRQVFLIRMMNGALAYHLCRASPSADEAVRNHLRGRTFYLDTTVLYSLVTRDGDLSTLRSELLHVSRELDCRLRVTQQTLHEFQESVRHYRELLEQRGIRDQAMARALLSE
ncbi:MAG TPA: hypothetical protein VIJ16_05190 [Gemmatimonadaceae bacterium]